jgi:putative ABC transport system substrate-binding protein
MQRRKFITIAGGAAVVWPFNAYSQQSAMPVVGFISSASSPGFSHLVAALRQGLSETGYVEGRNVRIEYRWAEGRPDRLPAMVTELVGLRVAVIVATGGPLPARVAKSATTEIPILFSSGADPVKTGLVPNFNRPGGNVTGIYIFTAALNDKRLGLLRSLVPGVKTVAVLVNPTYPTVDLQISEVEKGGATLGLQTQIFRASAEEMFEAVFAEIAQSRAEALMVCADPYFNSQRARLVALAARHAIPAIYEQREFATTGGLASYGISITSAYRDLGVYTGRILKGEKPANLPVLQPTRFETVVNLKTAKALGFKISESFLNIADEVIE